MKLRIEFPEDQAKERVEEAKEWEESRKIKGLPGPQPLVWELEEYHAPEQIKKAGDDIILETKHTKVTLHKDEVDTIIELMKK